MQSALVGVVVVLGWGGVAAAQSAACAASPAGAIAAARSGAVEGAGVVAGTGYRVESVRLDRAQGQRWAVIRSCDHAERPTMAMLTDLPLLPAAGRLMNVTALVPDKAAAAGALQSVTSLVTDAGRSGSGVAAGSVSAATIAANMAVPVVHAGDAVRLWRVDGMASIELTGTSEENGVAGARVRVRLMRPQPADGQQAPAQRMTGVVRGPGDVELQP